MRNDIFYVILFKVNPLSKSPQFTALVFENKELCRPPVGWGSTYCFTAVGIGVRVGVLVSVGVTPVTKAPPAQIFLGWHVFCSPGH